MISREPPEKNPHLVWVYPQDLRNELSASARLETTREMRRLGWRVTFIAAGRRGRQTIQGVEITTIPKPDLYLFGKLVFHFRAMLSLLPIWSQIDVIMFHYASVPWILPLRLYRVFFRRSTPAFVLDTRTLPMATSSWKARLHGRYHLLANKLATSWVDGQTAITLPMARALRIPERQYLGDWPSGVTPENFRQAPSARRWPSLEEEVRLIYIGALGRERKIFSLCRAVEAANRAGMKYGFDIIGKGPHWPELERLTSRSKDRMRLLPPIPHDQVWLWLAQAHVGVLPFPDELKFQVSSPIKLFEYMASGMPVLATKIVCHEDVIGKGSFVFWADDTSIEGLYAALERCWQNRGRLEEKGREAAHAVHSWTWSASAGKLSKALKRQLAPRMENIG